MDRIKRAAQNTAQSESASVAIMFVSPSAAAHVLLYKWADSGEIMFRGLKLDESLD
jgi:hypothetical protein